MELKQPLPWREERGLALVQAIVKPSRRVSYNSTQVMFLLVIT